MRRTAFSILPMFVAIYAHGATYTIGMGPAFDFSTLTAAIVEAASGDRILLAGETFDVTRGETFPIYLKSGVTIAAMTQGERPLIIGDGDSSTMRAENVENIAIEGVEVRGGKAVRGGGLYASNTRGVIRDCVFAFNEAEAGGGISSFGGFFLIEDCTFEKNHTTGTQFGQGGGGGMEALGHDHVFRRCTFRNNTTVTGESSGGGLNMNSPGSVSDCLFTNNGQTAFGGGAFFAGPIQVERCKFVGNDAKFWGGGAYIFYNSVTIRDSLFASNRELFTGDGGAGLACDGSGDHRVERCAFIGNHAIRGGAIACSRGSKVNVTNCLIAGNLAGGSGLVAGEDSQPTISFCTFFANFITCVRAEHSSDIHLRNCAFQGNSSYDLLEHTATASIHAEFCWFHNEADGIFRDASGTVFREATELNGSAEGFANNLGGSPIFPAPATGTWTQRGALDKDAFQTLLVDANADWVPGQFKNEIAFVNPNNLQNPNFAVVDNTKTTLTVWGDATAAGFQGGEYSLYRTKLSGRSPVVDQGEDNGPSTDLLGNPRPIDIHGQGREGANAYDIGAFEVQMEAALYNSNSDINRDGKVDAIDLLILEESMKN